jgi:hypothetical protein
MVPCVTVLHWILQICDAHLVDPYQVVCSMVIARGIHRCILQAVCANHLLLPRQRPTSAAASLAASRQGPIINSIYTPGVTPR